MVTEIELFESTNTSAVNGNTEREIPETNMMISPLKNVRHPTWSTCCLSSFTVVVNNSFSIMYIYIYICKMFCAMLQSALCNYRVALWSWQRHLLRLCLHNTVYIYTEHYTRVHVCIRTGSRSTHCVHGLATDLVSIHSFRKGICCRQQVWRFPLVSSVADINKTQEEEQSK
jgi:hypothetical protein